MFDLTGETSNRPCRSPLGDVSNKPSVVTNLARELGVADNKDAAEQQREVSSVPGKEPLADIMVEDGPGAEVDVNQCPGCSKSYKNSTCKPGKRSLRSTEGQ